MCAENMRSREDMSMPSAKTSFSLGLWPDFMEKALFLVPVRDDRNLRRASLTSPATGGAVRRILRELPLMPSTLSRDERGCRRTLRNEPSSAGSRKGDYFARDLILSDSSS